MLQLQLPIDLRTNPRVADLMEEESYVEETNDPEIGSKSFSLRLLFYYGWFFLEQFWLSKIISIVEGGRREEREERREERGNRREERERGERGERERNPPHDKCKSWFPKISDGCFPLFNQRNQSPRGTSKYQSSILWCPEPFANPFFFYRLAESDQRSSTEADDFTTALTGKLEQRGMRPTGAKGERNTDARIQFRGRGPQGGDPSKQQNIWDCLFQKKLNPGTTPLCYEKYDENLTDFLADHW